MSSVIEFLCTDPAGLPLNFVAVQTFDVVFVLY
jgi:hypothetical protein